MAKVMVMRLQPRSVASRGNQVGQKPHGFHCNDFVCSQ